MITNRIIVFFLRLGIRTNIFILSLIIYRNPLTSFKALRSLLRLRDKHRKPGKAKKFIRKNGKVYQTLIIPGWPSPAFNNFIKNELFRQKDNSKPVLQTVFLEVCGSCPLNCQHCSFGAVETKAENYKPERLFEILDKFKENNIRHIQFTGGEPLTRKETLPGLIKAVKGMDSWVLTSGYGLDAEYAKSLKNAGLTGVNISLDHWDAEKHNIFRGNNNSFKMVEEAVEHSLKSGLVVSISLCATRDFTTRANLQRLLQLITSWKVHFLRILEPKMSGRFENKDIRLNSGQLLLLEEFYLNQDNGQ